MNTPSTLPTAASSAPAAGRPPAARSRRPPRRWPSQQILDGAAEVEIEHHGAVYRLRVTSLGKLILTK